MKQITKEMAKVFDTVIFAQPHVTQKLWPKHCVKGTWGAELHKDLFIVSSSEQVIFDNHDIRIFCHREMYDFCKKIRYLLMCT